MVKKRAYRERSRKRRKSRFCTELRKKLKRKPMVYNRHLLVKRKSIPSKYTINSTFQNGLPKRSITLQENKLYCPNHLHQWNSARLQHNGKFTILINNILKSKRSLRNKVRREDLIKMKRRKIDKKRLRKSYIARAWLDLLN